MGRINLSEIYTAKELSEKIGKNRNYLSQAYRSKKYGILKNYKYRKIGGSLIFTDNINNDLSQLVTAKEASKPIGKNEAYFSHIHKKYRHRLKGIDYILKGETLFFTKKSINKFKEKNDI